MANIPEPLKADEVDPDREFEIDAVFVQEHLRISNWLEQEANEALGGSNASQESANAKTPGLMGRIEQVFCRKAERNPQLLVVMDADNGKLIGQSFPIGSRVDANVFDPATGLVASSTGEGAIHIFHEDSPNKLSVVEVVKTEFGAKTMAFDPKSKKLFLSTSEMETIPASNGQKARTRAKPGTFTVIVVERQ